MNRYLNKTDCIDCNAKHNCFIQKVKNAEAFYTLKKNHITYNKRETIIKEGTQVSNIVYIIEGMVKVYIEGPDKNIIIKVINSGDFIGLTSLFGDDTHYFSAVALKQTRVCIIESESFKTLVSECCEFSRELSRWYCKNYNLMLSKCLNLGLRQLNGKLASTLLYLNGSEFEGSDVFSSISRNDLAELSGMSMESVVRLLSDFNTEKIIEIKGKKIEIKDMKRLQEINRKG